MDMPVSKSAIEPTLPERPRPSRRKLVVRLAIMAVLLAVVLGGLYGFDQFRQKMIAQFFANNRPPPTPVMAVAAASEPMARYLEGIGSIVAVHQVTVSPEVSGRITKIMFESGSTVKAGDPLVQLNDEPEQGRPRQFRGPGPYGSIDARPQQHARQAAVLVPADRRTRTRASLKWPRPGSPRSRRRSPRS